MAGEAADPPPVFSVVSSHGYRITGLIGGPENRPARLALFVGGKKGSVIYSSFPATYEQETGTIRSDLGRLGTVDLSFQPTGKTLAVRSRCGGEPFSYPGGAFRGSIVFNGEERYTHVAASRAKLDARFIVDFLCGTYSESRGGASGKGASLVARRRDGNSYVRFEAIKNAPRKPALVRAEIHEGSGALTISRSIGARVGSGAFVYPPTLGAALVSPPAPFSGSARFVAGSAAGGWRGPLSADFPGRSGVRMTGPDFHVSLAHAEYELSTP